MLSVHIWTVLHYTHVLFPYHGLLPLTASNPPLPAPPPPRDACDTERGCSPSEGGRHRPGAGRRPGGLHWKFDCAFSVQSGPCTATASTSALSACERELSCWLLSSQKQENSSVKLPYSCRKFGAGFFLREEGLGCSWPAWLSNPQQGLPQTR